MLKKIFSTIGCRECLGALEYAGIMKPFKSLTLIFGNTIAMIVVAGALIASCISGGVRSKRPRGKIAMVHVVWIVPAQQHCLFSTSL